jgi:hypothetical protein
MMPSPVIRLSIESEVALEIGTVIEYTAVEGNTTMSV